MENKELIEKHFLNSLSENEEQEFKQLLKNNPDFKHEFIFQENLKKVIITEERSKLKEKLNGYEQNLNNKNNWRIAASVLLVIAAGWFSYQSVFSTNYDNLYAANYHAYPNTVYIITRGDSVESLERKAFVAYDSGDYEYAINCFKKLQDNITLDYIDFFLAQTYMKSSSPRESIPLFLKVIESNKSFVEESNWYLALSYLKLEDKVNAKKYLEKTIANYAYMKDGAKELLDSLD